MKIGYRLQVTGYSFFIFLLLSTVHCTLYPTFAAESTASASPSASLQTKLRQLQTEIASRAAEFKAEVSGRLQNKAYVGKIKSKTDETLILSIKENDKTVKINQFTEFIISVKPVSKTKPTIKNLEVENYIVALGDVDETDILTAKKVIKIDPPKEVKQIFFGKILAINENIITLKTDQNLAVSTSNQTTFKIGQKDGTLDNLKIGQNVVVSGISKNNIVKAGLIYVFN